MCHRAPSYQVPTTQADGVVEALWSIVAALWQQALALAAAGWLVLALLAPCRQHLALVPTACWGVLPASGCACTWAWLLLRLLLLVLLRLRLLLVLVLVPRVLCLHVHCQ